jgi:hypothetical protein
MPCPSSVRLRLPCLAFLAVLSCVSTPQEAPPERPADTDGAVNAIVDAAANATIDASVDTARKPAIDGRVSEPTSGHAFSIALDYRFDSASWFDAQKRQLLAHAANEWARYIDDDFPALPAGLSSFGSRPDMVAGCQPAHTDVVLADPVDDVVVFPGSGTWQPTPQCGIANAAPYDWSTETPEELRTVLDGRLFSSPFQPWAGAVTFDRKQTWFLDATPDTTDDLPCDDSADFLSTARHELGHVLGFYSYPPGSARQTPFGELVQKGADGFSFHGPKAMAVYGGPIPLDDMGTHFRADMVTCHGRTPAMIQSQGLGTPQEITALDLAVLEDVGYHIRWDLVAEPSCAGGTIVDHCACAGETPAASSKCGPGMTCLHTTCSPLQYTCFKAGATLQDGPCQKSTDCAPGHACVRYSPPVCEKLCVDDAGCAAGYHCSEPATCAGGSTPLGRTCHKDPPACSGETPAGTAMCGPGMNCLQVGAACLPLKFGCRPAGTVGEGSPCKGTLDCMSGIVCVGDSAGLATCRRLCATNADCLEGRLCSGRFSCDGTPLGAYCR